MKGGLTYTYNRIADYGLRTGFKGELKSGNHIFLYKNQVSVVVFVSLLLFLRNKTSANSANIKSCFISAKQVNF